MRAGYSTSDYSIWFSATAKYITKSPFTLYDDIVASSLTPLSEVPTQTFRLGFLATFSGSVTTIGSLAGVSKTETLTLIANKNRVGTYSFDSITSISCTCRSGTITVSCYNTTGELLENNTYTEFNLMFEDSGDGYWNQAGIFQKPSATAYTLEDIPVGTEVIYDKFHPTNPANGIMYILKDVSPTVDEDANTAIRVLKF
jgi:hypothetical protein